MNKCFFKTCSSIKNQKGMTLMEVMVVLMILSVISILTTNTLSEAIRNKGRIQKNIQRNASVRDALKIMERDIARAFNHRDLSVELIEAINRDRQQKATGPQVPGGVTPDDTPPPPVEPDDSGQIKLLKVPTYQKVTHFVGTNDSVHFTNLNNVRMMQDSQESDQQEVGYFLKDCRILGSEKATSKCLWRRATPYLDNDTTKGGDETVILENIVDFKLRYIGGNKTDWVQTWRSNQLGDADTQFTFPEAVEITLSTQNPDIKDNDKAGKVTMTIVAPVRFTNNIEKEVTP
jgi:prepilin-type N-terminal cleavage/methylation domain-containing protein